jgi:GNAT superfamily N-acetyltransferase
MNSRDGGFSVRIEVRQPLNDEELARYYDLRWRILREPWTQERESGRDELEDQAFHLTAWTGDRLTGAGRLHWNSSEEAQVRYMAVEEGFGGQGIGSLILEGLEGEARRRGATRIVLNARETAVPFYRKHSYRLIDRSGTLFESLPHWRMLKEL